MPIYEYRCGDCKRRVSILIRGFEDPPSLTCPECSGHDLSRLFSRFKIGKGESYYRKGVYEDMFSDPKLMRGLEANDPRAMAEWSRKMSAGADEEITPESREVLERLDTGESVEQVSAEAKELFGDIGMGDD